jgi:hypothetical protein
VLSLFFKAVLGIQRLFHFDSLTDKGFALLTGGSSILSRRTLGQWVRGVSTRSVNTFMRRTQPVVERAQSLWLSIDEHTVARFTRKFLIPKGFHTIRNKLMRAEKLFFCFDTLGRTLRSLLVTPGNGRLAHVSSLLLGELCARSPKSPVRVVLDAGAAHNNRELFALADKHPRQVLLVRTPRRTSYLKKWQALPEELFASYQEPGRYKGARPKLIHVAETSTALRAGKAVRNVRTIVVREEARSGKDRWHALFIFRDNATDPLCLIKEFRARQHHEQTYRVLLHDAFVDTVPSGYNKQSPNPDRPGFRKNAITLYAWLAGLAVNALRSFTDVLPPQFKFAHPRTLRRWWLNFPADLYLSDKALFVILRPRWHRAWWQERIKHLNAQKIRIPWLGERLLLYALDSLPRAEPPRDPSEAS